MLVRVRGADLGIPPLMYRRSNGAPSSGGRTVAGGEFDWGGRLPKCNGGAQRSAQHGWKSCVECKGTSGLDCEAHRPSRDESRA